MGLADRWGVPFRGDSLLEGNTSLTSRGFLVRKLRAAQTSAPLGSDAYRTPGSSEIAPCQPARLCSVAFCSPAKSLTFSGLMENPFVGKKLKS